MPTRPGVVPGGSGLIGIYSSPIRRVWDMAVPWSLWSLNGAVSGPLDQRIRIDTSSSHIDLADHRFLSGRRSTRTRTRTGPMWCRTQRRTCRRIQEQVLGSSGTRKNVRIISTIPSTPWDWHICPTVGVVWWVNVGIYSSPMECMGMVSS